MLCSHWSFHGLKLSHSWRVLRTPCMLVFIYFARGLLKAPKAPCRVSTSRMDDCTVGACLDLKNAAPTNLSSMLRGDMYSAGMERHGLRCLEIIDSETKRESAGKPKPHLFVTTKKPLNGQMAPLGQVLHSRKRSYELICSSWQIQAS